MRYLAILFATACIFTSMLHASAASSSEPKAYVYLYKSNDNKWCGVKDLSLFKSSVKSDGADQFDIDQARVEIYGGSIKNIEEYRTDRDVEISTLVRYNFKEDGNISFANLSLKESGAGEAVQNFSVKDGLYLLSKKVGRSKNVEFRKAKSVSSFPFSDVLTKLLASSNGSEVCT